MVDQPSNRAIAAAIAELGDKRLSDAAAYTRLCRDLVTAGIPRVEAALALDCENIEQTASLRKLEAWAREPEGCIALVGPPGCGKSFAAARVVIARARRGQRSCWLPAVSWDSYQRDAQREWLARGEASALAVVDDLGAGTTGSGGWVQRAVESEIEGMIMQRVGDGKPVIVIANGSEETISQQLGGRLVSRMQAAGGFVFLPPTAEDLRGRAKPPRINDAGRWPSWQAEQDLLDLVGCDEIGSWHRLHARASDAAMDRDNSREWLRTVAAKFGLRAADVRKRALSVGGREDVLCREASAFLKVAVDEYSFAGIARALKAKIAAQRERESRGTSAPEVKQRRMVWPSSPEAMEAARRTKDLGFAVNRSALTQRFELRFAGQPLAEHDSPDAAWLASLAHVGNWPDAGASIGA